MAPKGSGDIWHFSRPKLAEGYLTAFDMGLVSARALFAKRRMGKSEFLERDLLPAAKQRGYLTAYLNMWDARANPTGALVAVLEHALTAKGLSRLTRPFKGPLKKVKASAKLSGFAAGALEADLAEDVTSAGAQAYGVDSRLHNA